MYNINMKNEIKYFDVHSHLHSDFFNNKKKSEEIIKQMKEKGTWSTIIGVNFEDSEKAVKLSENNDILLCSIGIHPADEDKERWNEEMFHNLLWNTWNNDSDTEKKKNKKIVAIGECGLDYYWPSNDLKKDFEKKLKKEYSQKNLTKKEIKKIIEEKFLENYYEDIKEERERQRELFEKQIDFAAENKLPLMLHIRSFINSDAHLDALSILDKKQKEIFGKSFEESITGKSPKIEADFHFFTETPEIAREVIKRDFFISLPGVITFADLDKTILEIPINKLMVETDSPFATPEPFRKETNTPLFIPEIIKKIAEVKKEPVDKIGKETVKNAIKFFNL